MRIFFSIAHYPCFTGHKSLFRHVSANISSHSTGECECAKCACVVNVFDRFARDVVVQGGHFERSEKPELIRRMNDKRTGGGVFSLSE